MWPLIHGLGEALNDCELHFAKVCLLCPFIHGLMKVL
jgi:hypothetical protein